LNKNSNLDVGFFAFEIQLKKIGASDPAFDFEVICQPDEWSKHVQSIVKGEVTETEQLRLRFWTNFKEYMECTGTSLRLRKPGKEHWYTFAVGKARLRIALTILTRENRVGCELYIPRVGEKIIDILEQDKDDIEKECNAKLSWQRLLGKQAARIAQYKTWDVKVETQWPEIFKWMKERSETFDKVFRPRLKKIQNARA